MNARQSHVYYDGQFYKTVDGIPFDLPEGAYYYLKAYRPQESGWYWSDHTPVLLENVPPIIRTLHLLMA